MELCWDEETLVYMLVPQEKAIKGSKCQNLIKVLQVIEDAKSSGTVVQWGKTIGFEMRGVLSTGLQTLLP